MDKKNGNWTIKDSKVIYENDFFSLREDRVIQPDGADGSYAVIEYRQGVAVLPIDDENNVYLTKQFRYALCRENTEAIAGALDENEEPEAAARREAREELGIEADEWTPLGAIEKDTSIAISRTHLFAARGLSFGEPEQEGTEEIETVKMKFAEAIEKINSGAITHAETCVLILKAKETFRF